MIVLRQTSGACPEQYDAFLDDKIVGYLRLRHGRFTVTCPDVSGVTVYSSSTIGDGIFDDEERDYYLRFAVDAIEKWLQNNYENKSAPDVKYKIEYGGNLNEDP